ncbi:MAG: manganese efflux pump MntP family protein [Bacteroidales bacterium]|jgi:putative Mn2+ efflux pump MntP|nr:manganese efflux pump MntP family protein [Bacteroidales bacterium]
MISILIEATLVAVANCMDTLVVSTACGMQKAMNRKRMWVLALTFAVMQTVFPLIGILIGGVLKDFIEEMVSYIAFSLFLIIGIKALLEARHCSIKDKIFDISHYKIIFTLAVATSLDSLILGLGFGLQWTTLEQIVTLIALFVITLAFALIGVLMGSKLYFIKPKYALVFAGLIFIAMGVKTLFDKI